MQSGILRGGLLAMVAAWVLLHPLGAAASGGHDDPGATGPYPVGFALYVTVDPARGDRPMATGVWYPADARAIRPSTPRARYPFDPFTTYIQDMTSEDWEAMGYEPAFAGPRVARGGPFPLLLLSHGAFTDYWDLLYIATRLASHGYVVASMEHYVEWQWPWSGGVASYSEIMANRVNDLSFTISDLLERNGTPGELLHRAIDLSRIALAGHSLGGYLAYTAAGGDDSACDNYSIVAYMGQPWPQPPESCVKLSADSRVKAIVSLDGTSLFLRYGELARIEIPSLIMGRAIDSQDPGMGTFIARPHAAIARHDSYRIDVNQTVHNTYSSLCDYIPLMVKYGVWPQELADEIATWPYIACATTLPQPLAHQVITRYMIAFLDTHLGGQGAGSWLDWWILTPFYAATHEPEVQFITSERCRADLPDASYFTYRPYQVSGECRVALKDPPDYFEP